ncbi:MAG: acyl carrier protein [Deltaproteobacteria bacterium]|nr:acyl carrier protein [Deltaproteobacteria bacterium]
MIGERVRALVGRFAPGGPEGVADERPLAGAGGLGFDSVRLVELLLACEDELGVALPVEEVLRDAPLTVGRLVAFVERQAAP